MLLAFLASTKITVKLSYNHSTLHMHPVVSQLTFSIIVTNNPALIRANEFRDVVALLALGLYISGLYGVSKKKPSFLLPVIILTCLWSISFIPLLFSYFCDAIDNKTVENIPHFSFYHILELFVV